MPPHGRREHGVEQPAVAATASFVPLEVAEGLSFEEAAERLRKAACKPCRLEADMLIKALLLNTSGCSLLAVFMHAAVATTRWA